MFVWMHATELLLLLIFRGWIPFLSSINWLKEVSTTKILHLLKYESTIGCTGRWVRLNCCSSWNVTECTETYLINWLLLMWTRPTISYWNVFELNSLLLFYVFNKLVQRSKEGECKWDGAASLSKIWIPWLSYVLSRVQWTVNVNLNHCWSVPLPSRNFQNPTPKKIFVWKREEVYILYYMGHLPYSAIFFGKIAKFDWPPPQVSNL